MRLLALILVLALVLIGVGFVVNRAAGPDTGTDDPAARRLFEEGEEHLDSFQFSAAVASLEAALERDPDYAMAAATLAVVHAREGRRAVAESLAVRADSLLVQIEDEKARMLVELRLATHKLGSARGKLDSLLNRLDETLPHHQDVLIAKANRAKANGDIDLAVATWNQVLERNPNYASAYNELGYIAYYQGDYDRAIELLQRYSYLAPDLANPHDSLGEVLMHSGRYEEAVTEFRKALAKQPDYLPSIFNLARVYIARGQLEKGIGLLEKLRGMTAGTRFEEQVDELAIATYYVHQLWDELQRATAQYVTRYPQSGRSIFYRTLHLTAHGKNAAAEALLDSALTEWRRMPDHANDPVTQNNVNAAEAQIRAFLCENQHDIEGAEKYWRTALETVDLQHPHELRFMREQYANCLMDNGKPKAALEQVSAVLAVNPREIRSLILAAEACVALDRRTQARQYVQWLELALEVADPDFPLRERVAALQRELQAEQPSS